jgi:hypothetical protein
MRAYILQGQFIRSLRRVSSGLGRSDRIRRLVYGPISEQQPTYADNAQQNGSTGYDFIRKAIGHGMIVLAFLCVPIGILTWIYRADWVMWLGLGLACLGVPLVIFGAFLAS